MAEPRRFDFGKLFVIGTPYLWLGLFFLVPFVLVLMVLAEAQGAGSLWLHAAGVLLLVGRMAHPFGLQIENAAHPLRFVGNGANILAVLVLAIALVRIVTGL